MLQVFSPFFILKLFSQSMLNLAKELLIQALSKYYIYIYIKLFFFSNNYFGKKIHFFFVWLVFFVTCPKRLVITGTKSTKNY